VVGSEVVATTLCAVLLRRRFEPLNYLPIKIKMPAMSATIPITIAPMPM
jgi:hypothetical protein